MKHCIRIYHVHHIHYKIVQIHSLSRRRALFDHALDAPNHLTGAAAVRHNISKQVAKFAEIDIAAINKTLSRAGVAGDSRKRLIQFMGNGCRHFPHHCHTTEMADFLPAL